MITRKIVNPVFEKPGQITITAQGCDEDNNDRVCSFDLALNANDSRKSKDNTAYFILISRYTDLRKSYDPIYKTEFQNQKDSKVVYNKVISNEIYS